jgi:hypothetical protein
MLSSETSTSVARLGSAEKSFWPKLIKKWYCGVQK